MSESEVSRPAPSIIEVWRSIRGTVQEQVELVARVVADLLVDHVRADLETGGRAAHKLAGSLGSFGSAEGSKIAYRIETRLAGEAERLDALTIAGDVEALRAAFEQLDAALSPRGTPATTAATPGPTTTIVSLDDDPAIGAILTATLAPVGGTVIAVHRVPELWATLDQVRPDAILLDLDLPSANGLDLCRALRDDPRTAGVTLMILTATPSGRAVERAFAAGADDYLTKPIVGAELIARLSARHRAPLEEAFDVDVAIVEDDAATAALLQHLLDREGFSWKRFADGDEAGALIRGQMRARIILLDVGLPGLDGFGVLRKLSAGGILERTRVVMLTARSSEAEVLRALELGASDHLEKPFSLPILAHRIKRILQR